jgi:Holliday junction DNA helicase RuvA
MIGFLEGELLDKNPNQVVLKVGGVGYRVLIPLSTFYALPEPPARVSLLIYTRMQEDALNLYGFSSQEEKELFQQLLNIPRIGARMALNILSGIDPGEFAEALAQRDIRRLSGIPGIGKKSAERIILELKDKKSLQDPRRRQWRGPRRLSAVNLGYPKNVAEKALDAARGQGAETLENLLRQSLKWLSK